MSNSKLPQEEILTEKADGILLHVGTLKVHFVRKWNKRGTLFRYALAQSFHHNRRHVPPPLGGEI